MEEERRKRLAAEQQLGGLRSAVARLRAMLMRQRATEAERAAGPDDQAPAKAAWS